MFKVKVYNGWMGCYVGDGEYEGGSVDNYEFNSRYGDYKYVCNKCLELYDRLGPYCEVRQFKFHIFDHKGKLIDKGSYNDTPYRLTGDRSQWSSLKQPYKHVVVSRVKEEN